MLTKLCSILVLACLLATTLTANTAFGQQQTPQNSLYVPFIRQSPTARPDTVSVKSYKVYETDSEFYIVGEVANTTNSVAFNVFVSLRFTLSDGLTYNPPMEAQKSILQRVEPNSTTPFTITFHKFLVPSVLPEIKEVEVYCSYSSNPGGDNVQYGSIDVGRWYIPLSFSDLTRLFVIVTNRNAFAVHDVIVAVTYYDDLGRVIDVDTIFLRGSYYEANYSQGTSFYSKLPPTEYASYKVQAEGIYIP